MSFEEVAIYVMAFLVCLLAVEGAYLLYRGWTDDGLGSINRRMKMISARGGDHEIVLSQLRRDPRDAISQALGTIFPALEKIMLQSGLTISLSFFLTTIATFTVLLFLVAKFVLFLAWLPALAISLGVGILLPVLIPLYLRGRRMKAFSKQLPGILGLLTRSLRAGHPISSALGLVAQETADPAGTEFGMVVDEMTYGMGLDDALRRLSERIPIKELSLLVVSVQIQSVAGGNLAEVLENLSNVIRDRQLLTDRIIAMSAENRMSAMILGLLPFAVFFSILVLNPTFYTKVLDDELFRKVMMWAAGLLLVGEFILWSLVKPKV
jgi:tight adherence protein B